jgi:hypothetical protein
MPIYSIVLNPDRSTYDVLIKYESGARHAVLGFKTEEEAKAWVEEDQRRERSLKKDDAR